MISSVCVLAMLLIYSELAVAYGVTQLDTSYEKTFDKINDTATISEEMSDVIKNIDLEGGLLAFGVDLFNAGWKGGIAAAKLLFSTVGIMHAIIVDSAETLGIPSYFTNTFIALIVIIVVAMLISLFTKWEVND